jgi:flagellar biosynthesis/type III secretory pathway protein FliH
MKLNNLKRTIAVSALGLAAILGTGEIASAQTNKQIRKQEQKIWKQQQKVERQEQKLENMQARRYRVYRNGSYYQTDNRGAELLRQAVNRGYQEGFRAGQNDRRYRRAANYGGSSIFRSGNYGYQSYVDSSQYRYYFQQGFQRGYEDGYNSRYRYGSNANGGLTILGSILQGILNIQSY